MQMDCCWFRACTHFCKNLMVPNKVHRPVSCHLMRTEESNGGGSWLLGVFHKARTKGWCVRAFCTTCGAWEFRRAVLRSAIKIADLDVPDPPIYLRPGSFGFWLDKLDHQVRLMAREGIVKVIVAELKRLPAFDDCNDHKALRVVLIDLDGQQAGLDHMLAGSFAGDVLRSMREHSRSIRTEAARRQQTEDDNRKEKEARRKEHAARTGLPKRSQTQRISQGNSPIHGFLRSYAELAEADRLKKLADVDFCFSLDVIPKKLIPTGLGRDVLTAENRRRLIAKIDHRGGRWRKLLKTLVSDQPPDK